MTRLYITKVTPYGSSDQIVTAWTDEYGQVSIFMRGTRSPKSKHWAVCRPFQQITGEVAARSGGQMKRLNQAKIEREDVVIMSDYQTQLEFTSVVKLMTPLLKEISNPRLLLSEYALAMSSKSRKDNYELPAIAVYVVAARSAGFSIEDLLATNRLKTHSDIRKQHGLRYEERCSVSNELNIFIGKSKEYDTIVEICDVFKNLSFNKKDTFMVREQVEEIIHGL